MTPLRAVRSGLRFRALALVPVVCGALVLASSADAALTSPWFTCEAANATALTTCLSDLGTTSGLHSNEIIVLKPAQYFVGNFITIPSGVNLEITGSGNDTAAGEVPAWSQNPNTTVGVATLNGSQLPQSGADLDMITIPATSNVEFKAVTLQGGGAPEFATIRDFGDVEFDNAAFIGDTGTDIALAQDQNSLTPANAILNNSTMAGGSGDALETDSTSTATFYNSDVVDYQNGGIDGNANLINTLVANNNSIGAGTQDCGNGFSFTLTATHSIDSDGSCAAIAGSGITTDSLSSLKLSGNPAPGHGGPTATTSLGTGSAAIGGATNCLPADQRFFVRPSTSTCDVGAYQTGATQDTTKPTCPEPGSAAVVISTNSSGVKQEAVTVTPAPEGFGLDSVTAYTLANTGGFAPGTVSWNTVTGGPFIGATDWDATSPSAAEPDYNSVTPFTVTATKFSAADNVSGDTNWSFPVTDWAGQTTTCS
jgi:hypothetical protein